jgi:hypothetical protein
MCLIWAVAVIRIATVLILAIPETGHGKKAAQ